MANPAWKAQWERSVPFDAEYIPRNIKGFTRAEREAFAKLGQRASRVEFQAVWRIYDYTVSQEGTPRWTEISDREFVRICRATRQGIHKALNRAVALGWVERRQSVSDGRKWEYGVNPENFGNGELWPIRKCRPRPRAASVLQPDDDEEFRLRKRDLETQSDESSHPVQGQLHEIATESMETQFANRSKQSVQNLQLECAHWRECPYLLNKLQEEQEERESDARPELQSPPPPAVHAHDPGGHDHALLRPSAGSEVNDAAPDAPAASPDAGGRLPDLSVGGGPLPAPRALPLPIGDTLVSADQSSAHALDCHAQILDRMKKGATVSASYSAPNAPDLSEITQADEWPESRGLEHSAQQERVKAAFVRFQRGYPGDVFDRDFETFQREIKTDAHIKVLECTLELHRRSRKFQKRIYPSGHTYLTRGDWKMPPKDVVTPAAATNAVDYDDVYRRINEGKKRKI